MFRPDNWEDVKPFNSLSPKEGYYVAVIKSAIEGLSSKKKNPILEVKFDIAKGEFTDFYTKLGSQFNNDFLRKKNYPTESESAMPFFKKFILDVEGSNVGYKFDFTPFSLVGKYVGLLLTEYNYTKDGREKSSMNVEGTCLIQDVNQLNIDYVPIKKSKHKSKADNSFTNESTAVNFNDDDLPF